MFWNSKLFLYGLGIWIVATAGLRVAGERLLHPGKPAGVLLLFAVAFPAMALLARRLCKRFHLPREQWTVGAVSLVMPTLLLDPFSTAFFPAIFANMAPEVAGTFGGLMLVCCAGALVGVTIPGRSER